MAEYLIKASKHWMDDLSPAQISALSAKELDGYNSRSQIGDIIVVRSDGWRWGTQECLPFYIVIKIPGQEVNLNHEHPLISAPIFTNEKGDLVSKQLKVRRFRVPANIMTALLSLKQSVITRTKTNFINVIEEKAS